MDATDRLSIEAFARKAAELGPVKYFIDTAGASPNQASPEHILNLDLMGTGYAVDAFGQVMAHGGAGLVISSQTGYMMRLPDEVEQAILSTPTEELLDLPYIKEVAMQNSGIVTPLAYDEFAAAGDDYQKMMDASAAERTGTSDEIAEAAAFLLGEHARFITGTDLLIDGGTIAAIRTGQYHLNVR